MYTACFRGYTASEGIRRKLRSCSIRMQKKVSLYGVGCTFFPQTCIFLQNQLVFAWFLRQEENFQKDKKTGCGWGCLYGCGWGCGWGSGWGSGWAVAVAVAGAAAGALGCRRGLISTLQTFKSLVSPFIPWETSSHNGKVAFPTGNFLPNGKLPFPTGNLQKLKNQIKTYETTMITNR